MTTRRSRLSLALAAHRWALPLAVLFAGACTGSPGPESDAPVGGSSGAGFGGTAGAPASGASSGAAAGAAGAGSSGAAGAAPSTGGSSSGAGGATSAGAAGTAGLATAGVAGASGVAGAAGTAAAGAGGTSGGDGGSAGASIGGAGSDGGGAGAAGAAAGAAGQPDTNCGGIGMGATGLAERYAGCFPIGAAVDAGGITSHAALLRPHFNSVTAENEMKFTSLQPNEGSFTYSSADSIVNFAISNGMRVRGHTLVWHSQNPSWVFTNASKAVLLDRMRAHITAVMNHFKGKVYAWDVVNEAIMEDGSYRDGNEADDTKKSRWYEIIGEEYIAEAFKAAHAADPDAKLFYNDYYDYIPAKQQGIYQMLQRLLEQGVPVHGVGMQCHLNIEPSTDPANQAYYQDVSHLEDAIELYSSLGLEVQVTELDLSLYIPGIMYTEATYYTPATFTNELKAQQAARYAEFFELFRKHRNVLTGVTFWGIADDNTWLSEFSSMRQDFPLLFDTSHNPKPAFTSVMTF